MKYINMKKAILSAAFALIAISLFAQGKKPGKPKLTNALDSINYAYGMVMAANSKRQLDKDMNPQLFDAAFQSTLHEEATLLTSEQAQQIFNDYNKQVQIRTTMAFKADQKKFLESNKARKEVTTTASGLQYEVITKGNGSTSPKATDKVEVHYHGTLIDGTVFDSSVKRGQTSSFGLNQVIRGWTEGLQYMKEGDKFRFFIPSELAYGENPRPGGVIKPGATLIFEVELFKVMAQ
jgi:FKBP-type peptidyl-prolyl cis-trans isomerase